MSVPDQTSQSPYASVGRRIGGYLVDVLLAAIAFGVLGGLPVLVTGEPTALRAGYAAVLVLGLVQWYLLGAKGYTLGKLALGTRVVDAGTGVPIGLGRALLRSLVLGLAASCLVLLPIVVALLAKDPRRQGWHDKAAGSVELDLARGGLPAADSPAAASASPTAPPVEAGPAVGVRPLGPPVPIDPAAAPPLPSGGLVGPPPGLVSPPPEEAAGPAAPPLPPETTSVPAAEPAVDEQTRLRAVDRSQPASSTPGRRWVLQPGEGEPLTVETATLVGRDPDPALYEGAALWRLDDPAFTVSKTHALLTLLEGVAWIEDLHSTHGVMIRRNGDEALLGPRRPYRLLPGDTLVLGAFEITVH